MRKVAILLALLCVFSLEDWIYIVGVSGNRGVLAKLYLKIIPGNGNVYVDTYPLTKIDTQASAWIAKKVACEVLGVNCSKYDFLYRIEGESEIVGGPSAGAAMTVLTMALLSNTTIRKDVTITGTISPDWSIGPVGGIKYKYLAAKNVSKIFLIPYGEKTKEIEEIENKTKIIEVKDILEAFYYFTGKKIILPHKEINKTRLNKLLENITEKICEKARYYEFLAGSKSKSLENAEKLIKEGFYYSAASYCVRAISELYRDYLLKSEDNLIKGLEEINETIRRLENITINYSSDNDLEFIFAFIDRLENAKRAFEEGIEKRSIDDIALAKAKLVAAESWLKLVKPGNKTFRQENYREYAKEMISRAENSILYASTFSENVLIERAKEEIELAKEYFENGNYVEAIFLAKEAEALSELSIEIFGDKQRIYEKYKELSRIKIEMALAQGYYPLLAISYYEFGEILKNESIDQAIYFEKLAAKFSSLPAEIMSQKIKPKVKVIEEKGESINKYLIILAGIIIVYAGYFIVVRRFTEK